MNQLLLSVSIESGVLVVGDPSLQLGVGLQPDNLTEQVRQGKAICIGTGSDGTFGVIVRQTEDSQELLSEEGDKISSLREPLLIGIPSGKIQVSDMALVGETKHSINNFYQVEPGIYSCMIHMCDNSLKEFFGFVVVLKKSVAPSASNSNVREIETLG